MSTWPNPSTSFFLWLRNMTALKLAEVHRRHLGTQLRDAGRGSTLHRGGLPMADSVSLAAQLLGKLTAPSQAAIKAETRLLVQEALNSMDPIDREVLALKHFEQLSTTEIAEVLGLSKAGAGSRYLRASSACERSSSESPASTNFEERLGVSAVRASTARLLQFAGCRGEMDGCPIYTVLDPSIGLKSRLHLRGPWGLARRGGLIRQSSPSSCHLQLSQIEPSPRSRETT